MILLVHLLQYQLHLSEITDTDTKNNDNDQYRIPIQLLVHHYSPPCNFEVYAEKHCFTI